MAEESIGSFSAAIEGEAIEGEASAGLTIFESEHFNGNGRTCRTCHSAETGTISLKDIRQRFRYDRPDDKQSALFHIESDARDIAGLDGSMVYVGSSDPCQDNPSFACEVYAGEFQRVLVNGTFAVELPLADNVYIKEYGKAKRTYTAFRGTPSVLDTPTHDPVVMHDGRVTATATRTALQEQAAGAIAGHMGPFHLFATPDSQRPRQPTQQELENIEAYELTLFSPRLAANANEPPPIPCDPARPNAAGVLSPTGWTLDGTACTDAEARGYVFFIDTPRDRTNPKRGFCAACHSGPMLNTVSTIRGSNPLNDTFEIEAGDRFSTVLVAEINKEQNPRYTFVFIQQDGTEIEVPLPLPDAGEGGLTGEWKHAGLFKIPTLWNVKNTAPYFHDNSAETLEELMDHYQQITPIFTQAVMTNQEKADIVAYMRLL